MNFKFIPVDNKNFKSSFMNAVFTKKLYIVPNLSNLLPKSTCLNFFIKLKILNF